MNDLPARTTAATPSLSDLAISTPLWRLLSSNHASDTEIAEILENPELHAEAGRVCTGLAMRAAACGEPAVRNALQPLVLVYGVGDAARSPAFWQAYKVLAGLPVEALRKGVEDYVAGPDSAFFPKPGPLKALCDKHAEPIFKAAFRASRAAGLTAPKRRVATEAEREAVHAMARDLGARLGLAKIAAWPAKRAPEDRPYIGGQPDEGGITPQMRELMARRR